MVSAQAESAPLSLRQFLMTDPWISKGRASQSAVGISHAEAKDQWQHGPCYEAAANPGCSSPQGKTLRTLEKYGKMNNSVHYLTLRLPPLL